MSFRNECASLNLYQESLRGRVQDFQIVFNEEQMDINQVTSMTLDLFQLLMNSFPDTDNFLVRLVARVNFHHINNVTNETTERSYHFSSARNERLGDVNDFFIRHMTNIARRLDSFNVNGSNLLIKNIAHIHILVTRL